MRETIREHCSSLPYLLVSNKHDEVLQLLTSYTKNHPLRTTMVGAISQLTRSMSG